MADYTTTEPLFDWDEGDFVIINGRPRMAVGKERVKNAIIKVIKTQLDRYEIYRGEEYGTDIKSIIGKTITSDYKQSEIKRKITEAVTKIADVISVSGFSMRQEGRVLVVSFTVNTEYGKMEVEEKA